MNKDEGERSLDKNYKEPTQRQRGILKLFVKGVRKYEKIAKLLDIEPETVRSQISALYTRWKIERGNRRQEELVSIVYNNFQYIVKEAKAEMIAEYLLENRFEDQIVVMIVDRQRRVRKYGIGENCRLEDGEYLIYILPGAYPIPEEIRKTLLHFR